jgi:hypothetical protein
MIVPLKTPPQMLQPPDPKTIVLALRGLRTLTLEEMGEKLIAMPDDDATLNLIEEIDHLIWLCGIWLKMENLMVGTEFDSSKPSEPERWTPAPLDKLQWVMLDRYRTVGLEDDVREYLDKNAIPF